MTSLRARLKSITGLLTEGRLTRLCLLLIILLGAGLRFYNLGTKSLWIDELNTVTISAHGLSHIWQKSRGVPALFLVTHLVLALGDSEFILRMPSALEGILSIVVLYKVGEALYGREEGLVAALLLALSAYHLHYSQDLRFYPLLVLLSLLTLLFLWKALEEGKRKFWLGFVLATVTNLYNHVFAWLVLASEMIFAASMLLPKHLFPPNSKGLPLSTRVRGALRPFIGLVALLALVVVLYLPVTSPFIAGFFSQEFLLSKFVSPETEIDPRTLSWETLSFSFLSDKIFGPFGAGTGLMLLLYGAAFLYGLIRSGPRRAALAILWIGLPFPVLASVGIRTFQPRYVIYILPIYLLAISRGLVALGEIFGRLMEYFGGTGSGKKALLLGLVVGLFATANLPRLFSQYQEGDVNWREVADYLMTNVEPGDWILCGAHCVKPLSHYLEEAFQDDHPLVLGKDIGSRIPAAATENQGVWIVDRHLTPLNRDVAQHFRAKGALVEFNFGLWTGRGAEPVFATVIRVDQGESLVENATSALKTLIQLPHRPKFRFYLYLSLTEIYVWQGDLEQAYQALAAAEEMQPGDRALAAYYHELGDAYLSSGRAQEAAREYERALALTPELDQQAGFHLRLGSAYEESDRREEAIREYERVLELEPDNAAAQRALDALGE